jgi:hypothetical protein
VRAASNQTDDLADGIAAELGEKATRKEILEWIALVRRTAQFLDAGFEFVRGKDTQRRARAAKLAIRDVFYNEGELAELLQWARLAGAKGPDRRLDTLQWLCAHTACVLVEQYSDNEPTTTPLGPAHAIAQMLCEAITGEPQSDASCLKALRSVITWRKP